MNLAIFLYFSTLDIRVLILYFCGIFEVGEMYYENDCMVFKANEANEAKEADKLTKLFL